MTLGMLSLPRFVVLQSSSRNNNKRKNKYLRYAAEEGELHDVIACNGDSATDPNAKFEVEPATTNDDSPLVHIRSCYNNRYLMPSSSLSNDKRHRRYIVAAGEKPEEDRSQRSCTLFEPEFAADDPNSVCLLHVQSGLYLHWSDNICTLASSSIPNDEDEDDNNGIDFEFISWDSLIILPKYVAFRGDNGLYLAVRKVDTINSPCLQFSASDATDDRSVTNQIVPAPDGRTVRIKNVHTGSLWKRDEYNWICPLIGDKESSSSSSYDDSMLFQVVKIKNSNNNKIALQNLGNKHFCKRYTVKSATSGLRAMDSNVTEFAQFQVTELVTSRSIYNIQFRLNHARIIEIHRRIVASSVAINNTAIPRTRTLMLAFDDTRTMTWRNTSSSSLSSTNEKVVVRMESEVVCVGSGHEIVVTSGDSSTYEWGETATRRWRVKRVHKVVVPAMRKVTVRLSATVATCEVPFSYVQRDVFGNVGEVESCVRDDGFYSGTNAYDFAYETLEESLV